MDDYRRRFRALASTYVTFDPSGRYLLANLGGEQIYLYECSTPNSPVTQLPLFGKEPCNAVALPSDAEQLKIQANAAFQQRQYTTAIFKCIFTIFIIIIYIILYRQSDYIAKLLLEHRNHRFYTATELQLV